MAAGETGVLFVNESSRYSVSVRKLFLACFFEACSTLMQQNIHKMGIHQVTKLLGYFG
jgi:hypothetical protein